MKRLLCALIAALFLSVGIAAIDGPLTNGANLRVRTDENGYLLAIAGIMGVTEGPLTAFGNVRVRTDENGYLIIACSACGSGGTGAPTDATYITQTVSSGLSQEQALSSLSSGIMRVATTTGVVTSLGDVLSGVNGGTGVANSGLTITLAGNLVTAGANSLTLTTTGATNVTFPTSGTLLAAGGTVTGTSYLDTSTPTSITSTSANSCGTTSPALATGASNTRGSFTVGATSATDCTLTFSAAAAHKWVCSPSDETTAVLVRAVSVDTTTTKFQGVMTAGDVIGYLCGSF